MLRDFNQQTQWNHKGYKKTQTTADNKDNNSNNIKRETTSEPAPQNHRPANNTQQPALGRGRITNAGSHPVRLSISASKTRTDNTCMKQSMRSQQVRTNASHGRHCCMRTKQHRCFNVWEVKRACRNWCSMRAKRAHSRCEGNTPIAFALPSSAACQPRP